MSKRKKYDQYEIPFWGEWLNGDCLEKRKLVENLPILKEIAGMDNLPKKKKIFCIATLLNSFFEDLESAVYTKISLEKKRNLPSSARYLKNSRKCQKTKR